MSSDTNRSIVPVTSPYLPSREKLYEYLDSLYDCNWITNFGPLERLLTKRLADHFSIDPEKLVLVGNGSLALQVAFRTLGVRGRALTTPFSFIATSSTLATEGIEPVFSDIDSKTWNLDVGRIDQSVVQGVDAIVPVHVFGNVCDVDAVDTLATRFGNKVIYDASHAFDVVYDGKCVLDYGDASTISFHATKLFHTCEGGAIYFKNKALADKARRLINFGIEGAKEITEIGSNAKLSDMHAAMGLAVLDEIESIGSSRRKIYEQYRSRLGQLIRQEINSKGTLNYAYLPILLHDKMDVEVVISALAQRGVQAKRYFYPSLCALDLWTQKVECPVSRDISDRILCLPIYPSLALNVVNEICDTVLRVSEGKW